MSLCKAVPQTPSFARKNFSFNDWQTYKLTWQKSTCANEFCVFGLIFKVSFGQSFGAPAPGSTNYRRTFVKVRLRLD